MFIDDTFVQINQLGFLKSVAICFKKYRSILEVLTHKYVPGLTT